jgi:hypothetical protein
VDIHNHALAKPDHVYVLWLHQGLDDAQAIMLSQSGLRPYQIMDYDTPSIIVAATMYLQCLTIYLQHFDEIWT